MGGDVLLPFPFDPVLDPLVRGLRFVVSGADGTVVLDEQISGRDHWTVNSAGTRWVYAPHVGRGIVRATVRKKSSSVPGLLRFSVRGRGLYLPVSSAMLPLHATVVFDTPSADGGQCADATLACTLNLATGIISCG